MNTPFYVEIVHERIGDKILRSAFREATPEEIQDVHNSHRNGSCSHGVFYDVDGWMYVSRHCGVCNKLIGLI